MVTQVLPCPYCQGIDIVKNRLTPQGLFATNALEKPGEGQTFILDDSAPGQSRKVLAQIGDMALKGSGIRDPARGLHISPSTVIKELKKRTRNCNK